MFRPGAPLTRGTSRSNANMRSGAAAFGTLKSTKANFIAGQLARRNRLPIPVAIPVFPKAWIFRPPRRRAQRPGRDQA
ncbi:MAG: trimethylamine methyltransferase family protein [Pseudomonadota bacterium]